jgi:type II secretion system protein H
MPGARAFTLVEMILVMALLCVILGIAAPSLSRSFHQRNLNEEATRLLALTEYARDEAVSQGVPMSVWIDVETGHFGAQAMPGYEDAGARSKEFTLIEGLHFDVLEDSPSAAVQTAGASQTGMAGRTGAARPPSVAGQSEVAEFLPDGTLDPSSQPAVRLEDRSNSAIEVAQTKDAWGYEIVEEAQ